MEIRAPWTDQQVAALNRFQQARQFHPFTCPNVHISHSVLVATTNGWECRVPRCGYVQSWAHGFMAEVAPDAPQAVTAEFLAERIAEELRTRAHACDGLCGRSEAECYDSFQLTWFAVSNGNTHVVGSVQVIAEAAARVAKEMGLLPSEG